MLSCFGGGVLTCAFPQLFFGQALPEMNQFKVKVTMPVKAKQTEGTSMQSFSQAQVHHSEFMEYDDTLFSSSTKTGPSRPKPHREEKALPGVPVEYKTFSKAKGKA